MPTENHDAQIIDTNPHFKIDGTTRAVTNESEVKISIMQTDHNSQRFTFEIPRYIDGHDMSTCNLVQIHYLNGTNPGVYDVDDLKVDPENSEIITCSWLLSSNATETVGSLNFALRFACVTDDNEYDYVWNTAVFSGISVSASIYNTPQVVDKYIDVLEQWKDDLFNSVPEATVIDKTLTKSGQAADAKVTGDSVTALKGDLDRLSGFNAELDPDEVRYGNHKGGVADYTTNTTICTRDYVKPFVKSITVVDADYQLAVCIFNNGAYERTVAWIGNGSSYTFDHSKQYKLYIGRVDEAKVLDFDAARKSVMLTMSGADVLYTYNRLTAQMDVERENTRNALEYMMRRNYDISFANAPAPLNLITYVGNNQIVHPKVLYFPNKFGKYRFWMAYNPYPWADGDYENPCVAYSDDGCEWTNINANPLDDPSNHGDIGVNTDVHLVYVEAKQRLEVWWRYVDKDDSVETKTETLYRRTSGDGINWTDRETVLVNSSGDIVQHLSPCILHDGSKYKVWVVNDTEGIVKYYEGMEEIEVIPAESIALNDEDMFYGKALANGTIEESTIYMYTDKIKLNETKTFSLTGLNVNGVLYHIPIRHIVAYDADGNRLSNFSSNTEITGGTVSSMSSRPIVMDDSVDSVVLTLYKPKTYTDKTIVLEGKSGGSSELTHVRDIPLTFPDDTSHRLWHIDVIEDNGKTVMLPMCRAKDSSVAIEQTWSLFLCTSDDNITFTDPEYVIKGNPYGWDKQIYRSSIVNVDGEYRIYYSAQDEKQRHGLGLSTSRKLSEFVGKIY